MFDKGQYPPPRVEPNLEPVIGVLWALAVGLSFLGFAIVIGGAYR